jgi:hypothetical protein
MMEPLRKTPVDPADERMVQTYRVPTIPLVGPVSWPG